MKTRLNTLLALAPAAVAALTSLPAQAAPGYFLQLSGIEGESIQKGHEKWIEVQSWSFGATAESSWTKGGGASVGKPAPAPCAITATLSKVSPELYRRICSGQAIDTVTLAATKTTSKGNSEDFYTIKLEGVFLTSVKTGGSPTDGGLPSESVNLVFKTATWGYKPQDTKGNLGSAITASWNVATGAVK